MPNDTLANLANSAFVRTPPPFAARIVRCLSSFPMGKTTNIRGISNLSASLLLIRRLSLNRLHSNEAGKLEVFL